MSLLVYRAVIALIFLLPMCIAHVSAHQDSSPTPVGDQMAHSGDSMKPLLDLFSPRNQVGDCLEPVVSPSVQPVKGGSLQTPSRTIRQNGDAI